jgi:glutaredoxin
VVFNSQFCWEYGSRVNAETMAKAPKKEPVGKEGPQVILYEKPDCPLCEEAGELLRELQEEFTFELKRRSISGDPLLWARYRDVIPVILVDGKEVCRGVVSLETLERALRRAQRTYRLSAFVRKIFARKGWR